MNRPIKSLFRSEGGYASFVIALVTIIVVSLIVVAFASDSRLEQKNSLANVLETQAYYAAESGINDAFTIISAAVDNGQPPPSSTTGCNPSSYVTSSSNQLNGSLVSYSCLIINATPTSLYYQDLVPGAGQVVEVDSAEAAPNNAINSIRISWQYAQGSTNLKYNDCPTRPNGASLNLPTLSVSGSNSFSPDNCGAGILQVDLVPDSDIDGQTFNSNPQVTGDTVYLEPRQNPDNSNTQGVAHDYSINTADSSQAQVAYVYCNAATPKDGVYACTETLDVNPADQVYYLHLQSFYQPVEVAITANNSNVSGNLPLADSQIEIDSTGDANGQLKRLVERVCYGNFCSSSAPDAALISNQCIDKEFGIYPGQSSPTNATCNSR